MKAVTASNLGERADIIDLNGFSAIRINSQTGRWNGITSISFSGTVYQAICYWNSSQELVIGKRVLDDSWTLYNYSYISVAGDDNHDTCEMGFDPNGYIHISYGMHSNPLAYRRSDAPINTWTGLLTGTFSMLGTNETQVTYPTFFNDPSGNLYFIFRDGVAGNGDMYMYKYNHNNSTWLKASGTTAGKVIDGKSDSLNPYWEHPCFDADFGSGGYLHLAWHFRDLANPVPNRSKSYAKWDGLNWQNSTGTAQTMPIRIGNAEVIDSDGVDNYGMGSFNTLYSDSNGNPHIFYPKTGADTYRHLYHAYHNGSIWTISQISTTTNPVIDDLGHAVDLIPEVAIDRNTDTIYILHKNFVRGDKLIILKSTDFVNWIEKEVYLYPTGGYWPKIDYTEFERSKILYVLIEAYWGQYNIGVYPQLPIYLWKVNPAIW